VSIGDILSISVLGDPDTLVDSVVVAPDGNIYYLFLEGIRAEGKTLGQLKAEIEKKLENLFLEPSVTIFPRFMSNQKFIVLGRVGRPGVYPLLQALTLRQGLAIAGGLISDREILNASTGLGENIIQTSSNFNVPIVSLKRSFLMRNGKKMDVNFEDLILHPERADDILLKPGDYIYLAADDRPGVFILGAVNAPSIVPHRDDLTFLQALAYAGGWPEGDPFSADVNNAIVIRGSLECPEVARVNLCDIVHGRMSDFYLKPGDIIYLHNKNFRFGRALVYAAVNGFIQGFTGQAAAYYGLRWLNSGG
jgi:polysaccharide export outer membrane protein